MYTAWDAHTPATLCRGQAFAYVSVLSTVTNGGGIHMSQRVPVSSAVFERR